MLVMLKKYQVIRTDYKYEANIYKKNSRESIQKSNNNKKDSQANYKYLQLYVVMKKI